ncbi:MAG: P-loop NTPase fold protein [Anaerolineales bacterium]
MNAWSLETTESLVATVASEIQRATKEMSHIQVDLGKVGDLLAKMIAGLTGSSSILSGLSGTIQTGIVKASRQEEIREVASLVTARTSFEKLIEILAEKKSGTGRVIIFIDDLDRALPDQIADILKNLKLVLDLPNCVFFLGMDRDIVANSIESYYKRRIQTTSLNVSGGITINSSKDTNFGLLANEPDIEKGFGLRYLEKMVQISVDVPTLVRETVVSYLEAMNITPEIIEIVRWAPDSIILNPRSLKRYINWLSVSLQLMQSTGLPEGLRNITALRLLALQKDYPEIYEGLTENKAELDYPTILSLKTDHLDYYRSLTKEATVYLGGLKAGLVKALMPEVFQYFEDDFDNFLKRSKNPAIDERLKSTYNLPLSEIIVFEDAFEPAVETIFSKEQYRKMFFAWANKNSDTLSSYSLVYRRQSDEEDIYFFREYLSGFGSAELKLFKSFVARNPFFSGTT